MIFKHGSILTQRCYVIFVNILLIFLNILRHQFVMVIRTYVSARVKSGGFAECTNSGLKLYDYLLAINCRPITIGVK